LLLLDADSANIRKARGATNMIRSRTPRTEKDLNILGILV
jgi:hypothetical protein